MINFQVAYYNNDPNLIFIEVDIPLLKKAICEKPDEFDENEYLDRDTDTDDDDECDGECGNIATKDGNDDPEDDDDPDFEKTDSEILEEVLCKTEYVDEIFAHTRYSVLFKKGGMFTREETVYEVMMALLKKYDLKEGKAESKRSPIHVSKKGELDRKWFGIKKPIWLGIKKPKKDIIDLYKERTKSTIKK